MMEWKYVLNDTKGEESGFVLYCADYYIKELSFGVISPKEEMQYLLEQEMILWMLKKQKSIRLHIDDIKHIIETLEGKQEDMKELSDS